MLAKLFRRSAPALPQLAELVSFVRADYTLQSIEQAEAAARHEYRGLLNKVIQTNDVYTVLQEEPYNHVDVYFCITFREPILARVVGTEDGNVIRKCGHVVDPLYRVFLPPEVTSRIADFGHPFIAGSGFQSPAEKPHPRQPGLLVPATNDTSRMFLAHGLYPEESRLPSRLSRDKSVFRVQTINGDALI